MTTHGTLKTFDPEVDDWQIYIERLKHYFIANGVTDAGKKRSILLTVCGPSTYKLLRSLVANGDLDCPTYDELVLLAMNHYKPKPSVIVQRFNFNKRTRAAGESITAYVTSLRELALHCEYGGSLSETCGYRQDTRCRNFTLYANSKILEPRHYVYWTETGTLPSQTLTFV